MRKPKTFEAKHKINDFTDNKEENVLGTIDISRRTEKFYSKFAMDSLENDIYLENRYFY